MDKKRKRLSYGLALKNSGNNELALVENDDEKEKQERRKSRLLLASSRKSLAGSFGEEDNLFSNQINNIPPKNPLSNHQLAELYSICLRLCSENKINTKNTWSLDLIDYIDDVLDVHKGEDKHDGPGTNFQAASATLDASIKIYSSRVDSVYSEAYKVAGGLTNENDGESQETNENTVLNSSDNEDDEDEIKEKKKRVRKANRATNTLCTNDSEITVKKFDLEFSVDPLFRKTSAAFDEGGAKGLLFNHLTIHKCCEIVFDSLEMNNEDNNSLDISLDPIDVTDLRDMLYTNQPNLSKLEICPAYVNWTSSEIPEIDLDDYDINFDKANDELEDNESASVSANDIGNEMYFDGDMNFDDQPLPVDINDDINNVILDDSEEGKDYSYFNFNKIGGLNGTQHWKFNIEKPKKKRAPKKEVKYDEDGNIIEPKRKSTKKNIKIDFFGKEPEGFEKLFEPAGRSSTTLTKAALAKQERQSESLLLPEEEYDKENFTKLFLHRTIDPSIKSNHDFINNINGEDETFNEELENYDMDNIEMDETYPINNFEYELDGEIAKPRHQAEVLQINYAKVDKKVDVKALKNNIWNEISKTDNNNKVKEEKSFQEVLDSLPDSIPSNVIKNISVPYCFVCLLHLANEKSLSLTQESFDELIIRQNVNN